MKRYNTSMGSPDASMSPVRERIELVDALRGFALFGVFMVNFTSYADNMPREIAQRVQGIADYAVEGLIFYFFEDKFITLFSILFGLGFGIQLLRAQNSGADAARLFLRRILWLLLFGIIHVVLWHGDILHIYAITGFFLLLLRNRSNRFLLTGATVGIVLIPAIFQAMELAGLYPWVPPVEADYDRFIQEYYSVVKSGELLPIISNNLKAYMLFYIQNPYVTADDLSETLGRFLLGFWIARRGFFLNIEMHLPAIRRLNHWCVPLIALHFLIGVLRDAEWLSEKSVMNVIATVPGRLGLLATSMFYATSLILLWHSSFRRRIQMLTPIGRTALTNYLSQTAFSQLLMFGFGLSLIGVVGTMEIALIVILIYTLQVGISILWLKHFQFGPTEWLWRTLVYQRIQPFGGTR